MGRDDAAPAWPTLVHRSRLRDTVLAVAFSIGAVAGWLAVVWVLAAADAGDLAFAVPSALGWTGVAWLMWLNRRRHVVLAETDLVIRMRFGRTRIPYARITDLSVGAVRGVVVETEDGASRMLPWPPLRTASGGGLSRAREVHDELSRRVAAARAGTPR